MEGYTLTLEFADMDALALNIPVEIDHSAYLADSAYIHVGVLERGKITASYQVPLVLIDDPFGGGQDGRFASGPGRSILAFERFMQKAQSGQPIHRDDLGNEELSHSILGGMSAAVLQLAPQLVRQRTLEAAPQVVPQGPTPPGLGPGASRGRSVMPPPHPRKSTRSDDFDD